MAVSRGGLVPCLLVPVLLASLAVVARADFDHSNFVSLDGLNLIGSAAQLGDKVRLTLPQRDQDGRLWSTTEQFIAGGFETIFDFRITLPGGGGADMIEFILTSDETFVTTDSLGFANGVVVEIDTYRNQNLSRTIEPNDNHVAVRDCPPGPEEEACTRGVGVVADNVSDGRTHAMRISYAPGTLSVFVDEIRAPVLSIPLDLADVLNLNNADGRAWVGLRAITGAAWQAHDILSWSFSVAEPTETPTPSSTATETATPTPTATAKPNGVVCLTGDECSSGFCSDSVCCDGPCDAWNDFCALPGFVGRCVAVLLPTLTPTPTPTPKSLGAACVNGPECESTFCANGVCCERACNAENESCVVPGFEGRCIVISIPGTATTTASVPTVTATPIATPRPCVGDCNGDRSVSQGELRTGIHMMFGGLAECSGLDVDHDGQIRAHELVAAVRNSWDQCAPGTL